MRLASVALVLVLFAAAVSATKDGAAADGKSELAIKMAKESADDMSKKAANLPTLLTSHLL
jgi:predicted RecA/RadA family phage recombinase